ncbi:conserved hypothetical protein [uncultured Stenotrophomonas sp.]|uniref:Uncharacterized protein n=1 Tax=uncultured Stenotrophomonas sp. TaxID=165438 RepID=A0A1Y5Q3Q0_9GAMM|nr:conserved hypothetical protein [uncultured Stenotrophomonas sp.]
MGNATIAPGHDETDDDVRKLTMAGLAALHERMAGDDHCDAALAGFARPRVLHEPLRALVRAQHLLLQAEHDVERVADVLRRDQKYAPAGRPSIHIVQLRKQQAAARQVMLVARQRLAQAAQTFVQASGLPVKAGQTPSTAAATWLQSLG